jgi:hypothetical protein
VLTHDPADPTEKDFYKMAKRQTTVIGQSRPANAIQKRLSLDDIKCDRSIQPRVTMDKSVVAEYAERLQAGDSLPAGEAFFDGEDTWLAAGFHRKAAHAKAGRKQMDCFVFEGTKADAQWHAIQSNRDHGLRRTNDDKVRAIKMAFAHPNGQDMSDRGIADLVGVSPTMAAKYRPKSDSTANNGQSRPRVGRDGRKIKTAKIGKKKVKTTAKPAIKASDGATTQSVERAVAVATPTDLMKPAVKQVDAVVADDAAAARQVEQTADVDGAAQDVETDAAAGEPSGEVLVGIYRNMLINLPASLGMLAKHAEVIAGKAMESKDALAAIDSICTSLDTLYVAEDTINQA